MRLGHPRSPVLVLLFTFLTCGLYYLWIIYIISSETKDFLGETEINVSPAAEVLLTIVTFGIWDVYWDYRMGKRMALMCRRVGLPITDNAVLYLVLDLVGVGFINIVLQQDTLNRVWKAAQTGAQPQAAAAWPPPPGAYGSGGNPPSGSSAPYAPPTPTATPATSSDTDSSEPQTWYSSSGKAPRKPRPPLKKK